MLIYPLLLFHTLISILNLLSGVLDLTMWVKTGYVG